MSAAKADAGAWVTARIPGHFGEFLQGTVGGEVALITLPCPALAVRAAWRPGRGRFDLAMPERLLSRPALRAVFHAAGRPIAGQLRLRAEMTPGDGAGASTAAIVALARVLGLSDPADLAALCHRVEGASDPLMFGAPERLLWASRRAVVLRRLPALPAMDVIGGALGPPRRTDPADRDFPPIDDLVAAWADARGDLGRLAALATEGALRAARHGGRPDPAFLGALLAETGALGVAIAHTGSLIALLFHPGRAEPARAREILRHHGFRAIRAFRVP